MGEAQLTVAALGVGYVLDLLLGDPAWLPHPVVGFGRAISLGERALNSGGSVRRFLGGALLALGLVGGTFALTALAVAAAWRAHPVAGAALVVVGVFFGLANRTLIDEGRAVLAALDESLDAGRRRLSRIVGRDTARLDDAANFVPARLTALLQCALAGRGGARGLGFLVRYGRAHASPNSGYPEAALAGILDVRFGGPHTYDGELVHKPWIGSNTRALAGGEFGRIARLNHAVALAATLLAGAVWWHAPEFLLPWAD